MTDNEACRNEAALHAKRSKLHIMGQKIAGKAAAFESRFLSILRYAALLIAGLALAASAGFLLVGLINQLGKTEVNAEKVVVNADDLAPPAENKTAAKPDATPAKPGLDNEARAKTLAIYRARFKPFQRPDNKMTDDQVVDFIWTDDRITAFAALASGDLTNAAGNELATPKAVALDALVTVDAAAQAPAFHNLLAGYHDAQKQNVCSNNVNYHTRLVRGWNSSSMACSDWYKSPIGCPSTRVVTEPVTTKVCEMKYPDNLSSPTEQFAQAIQRYADTAKSRLDDSRASAGAQSQANLLTKEQGKVRITYGGVLFLGFLGIMFLYLFVALERHHRSLRLLIKQAD